MLCDFSFLWNVVRIEDNFNMSLPREDIIKWLVYGIACFF